MEFITGDTFGQGVIIPIVDEWQGEGIIHHVADKEAPIEGNGIPSPGYQISKAQVRTVTDFLEKTALKFEEYSRNAGLVAVRSSYS